jgi:ubiquinone/menaquinone biosynthesis C-methylase UbiE
MKKNEAKKIMNDLRKDYNLVSPSFARSRDRVWPELKFLFDYTKAGEKILDLGCGNGRFSQYLEETDYVGIDFSEGMISEARKRFPKKTFFIGDLLSLPFKEECFDKIYSIAVIHHLPSHGYRLQALAEIKRVLKKEGLVFLTAWKMSEKEKENVEIFFRRQDIYLKRKRYYYLFEEKELSSLLQEAGFLILKEGVASEKGRNNFYIIAKKK